MTNEQIARVCIAGLCGWYGSRALLKLGVHPLPAIAFVTLAAASISWAIK